ncbi:TBC1 domain family member 13-like isoform X2 [Zingiber officinale]|uniref:TBC1 domain family member 13-like isoform X2 n=1 Tax=Zingiber officinale TaxID=94328 RepID=UPI001C4AC7BB|nr:TBC1 domain family member 13-like isoform X2 [Zingiber officinale]XP_042428533.1 TBC1 domain family member 13-like isoform X2 [Zingiber officinale]
MGKKGVPEWLNSSLWSSPSSAAATVAAASHPVDRLPRSSPLPKPEPPMRATIAEPRPPPRPTPPLAEAPRLSTETLPDDPEPSRLSEEDVSRQSHLLAELLLGYLPKNRELWGQELNRKRAQYNDFREEFLVNPSAVTRRMEGSSRQKIEELESCGRGLLMRSGITHDEHPLSLGKTSVWNQFFQDTEIIEQIDRDVKRTHPDMQFFNGDSSIAESNREAMRHILIIFAKLNPGIRYVQGMNEILAPLFYVFKNDPEPNNAEHAEADAFFCFVELLSGFRDNFCQKLDNSVVGIRSTISKLSELLKKHDGELWRHLEVTTKVNPQFYAFRWITLLLTQEFNFANCLHIWDTLLSDPEGPQETLLRICCAMLILVRRRLLAGDFTSNLKLLQNYPSTNISHLLYAASKLGGPSAS